MRSHKRRTSLGPQPSKIFNIFDDDLQWFVPDDELVHVRRGKEVAVMPLATIHQWLYPFGPFDARIESYPCQYVNAVLKARTPVNTEPLTCMDLPDPLGFDPDFEIDFGDDWEPGKPDDATHCGSYRCDGTCEQCSDYQRQQREHQSYMQILSAYKRGHKAPIKQGLVTQGPNFDLDDDAEPRDPILAYKKRLPHQLSVR